MEKYYEWGEWPELLLYKCFWLNVDARVHKILKIYPKEIIDLKGHYLWEKEVFDSGKRIFCENFEKEGWFKQFSDLADKLTSEILLLENSDDFESVFKLASECLSCSEVINLFDHALVEYIENNFREEKQSIFDAIHPVKNTHIMELQADIREGKTEEFLLKKYPWVGTHGFEGEPFSIEKINGFRTKESFSPIFSDSKLIKIGSQLAFYRSYIVETVDKILFSIIPHLKKFATDNLIDITDVYNLTPQEVLSYKELPMDINERKISYGIISNSSGMTILVGDKLNKKLEQLIFVNIESYFELKGMTAYKGKVVGSVRIILDKSQLTNVMPGEIIISNETTPEYVVAMKKAAAIITNLGGITSHAAIVAREMKIPCITGTKIATKIFNNGDIVEVDADKGIVRIIK